MSLVRDCSINLIVDQKGIFLYALKSMNGGLNITAIQAQLQQLKQRALKILTSYLGQLNI